MILLLLIKTHEKYFLCLLYIMLIMIEINFNRCNEMNFTNCNYLGKESFCFPIKYSFMSFGPINYCIHAFTLITFRKVLNSLVIHIVIFSMYCLSLQVYLSTSFLIVHGASSKESKLKNSWFVKFFISILTLKR